MKILIATPLYPPEPGGPATYAKLLEEGLPQKGIETVLVKFGEFKKYPKVLRHLLYLARLCREGRSANAILALDPVSTGVPAALASMLLRKPLVVKIVGDYAWEQGTQRAGVRVSLDEFVRMEHVPFLSAIFRKVQAWTAVRAKRIIVPSEYLKGIVSSWGILEEKITVVHNAVEMKALGEVPEGVKGLGRPLVVTAGRLVPWKGISGVIDMVHTLRDRFPDVSLAIVGDGDLRDSLETYADARLGSNYSLTGPLSHEDTLATIAAADLFVLNSTYEGLSHLLIESLSLGAPTLATRVGGNTEVITDGEDGLLVPSRDQGALAEAAERILGDKDLAMGLHTKAKASSSRFSVEHMIERTAALFSSP